MPKQKTNQCVNCHEAVWAGVKCCHPCRRTLTIEQKLQMGILHRPSCQLCGDWCMNARYNFCSKACRIQSSRNEQASKFKWKNCRECRTQFVVTRGRKQFCCRDCSYTFKSKLAQERAVSNPKPKMCKVWFPSCVECDRVFCARSPSTRRCSYQCRIANDSIRVIDLYAASTEVGADGKKWRKLLIGYLRERDGDKCQCGCRRTIQFDLPSGPKGHKSGMGASVDHIIPRSLGGGNEMANLRLLTWKCNRRRGNRGGNEQLALIG